MLHGYAPVQFVSRWCGGSITRIVRGFVARRKYHKARAARLAAEGAIAGGMFRACSCFLMGLCSRCCAGTCAEAIVLEEEST